MNLTPGRSGDQIQVAIVGVGKIARDQHVPAIAASPDFNLVATASRSACIDGVRGFASIEEMLANAPEIEAVALCVPPQVRRAMAMTAIATGRHVFLEKPPGATLGEVAALAEAARAAGVTLFASWHSRFAPGVEHARAWLAAHPPRAVRVTWKEDVEYWHPGQRWIWEPGGMGVFDPGINALSILTHIMPRAICLREAALHFPANCEAPIAADLTLEDDAGAPIEAAFDFRQKGPQSWDIEIDTDDGPLMLTQGGAALRIGDAEIAVGPEAEYPGLYARFASLIRAGQSEADVAPFTHVADAFLVGRRFVVEPFNGV